MENYSLYYGNTVCGELEKETNGLYSEFRAEFEAKQGMIYRLWLNGERGQLSLGVPEWNGKNYCLKRKMANQVLNQIGTIENGIVCEKDSEYKRADAKEIEDGWMRLQYPEYFFQSIMPQLEGNQDCYWKPTEKGRFLAIPISNSTPFLLPRYFCFARIRMIRGKSYAVFFFDQNGNPMLES